MLTSTSFIKSQNSSCLSGSYQQTDPYTPEQYITVDRLVYVYSAANTQGPPQSNRSVPISPGNHVPKFSVYPDPCRQIPVQL